MQRTQQAAVGLILGLLVSGLVAGLPAQADEGGGRTAFLLVQSPFGEVLTDVSISYEGLQGGVAKAVPVGDGTCVISGAPEKCTLFIEHEVYGNAVVDVILPAAKSTVLVELSFQSATAKVLGLSVQTAPRSVLDRSQVIGPTSFASRGGSGGGEDCPLAPLIPGLPFSDIGTTGPALDDYNEACGFSAIGGRDVVYAFAPAADVTVDITLCANSDYDTKLYVYENTCPGPVVGCNDDTCSTPSFVSPFVSELLGLSLVAGNTYFIVVDSFSDIASGTYTIDITEGVAPPPPASCDDGVGCQLPDQLGHGGAGVLAATSDPAIGFTVAENFVVTNDSVITSVCWWGVYLDFGPGADCSPGPGDNFTITYYSDDAGGLVPGSVKAGPFSAALTLTGKGPTGNLLAGLTEWSFTATHPAVAIAQGECCWIEITNTGNGVCAWLWSSAPPGDNRSAQNDGGGYANTDYDLAFCVNQAIDDGGCGAPAGPPNDDCAGAESVNCNGSVTFDNSAATTGVDEPAYSCHFGGAAQGVGNMWFSFVATETSAFLETNNGPASDTLLAVYDGSCGSLMEIGCSEDEGDGLLSEVCVDGLILGNTYLVQVGSFSAASQGLIVLDITCPCPQPPANDFCADAIPVGVPSLTPGTTSGTTTDSEAPFCGVSPTAPGVWYSAVGTGNTMTASICNGVANFDSKLTVYCGDCDDLTCLDGNDDACGLQSEVSWCSQNGATYLILVHGFGGANGPFELEISDNGASCTADVACLPQGACCDGDFGDGCTHEVELFDSFGDGWNGATMDVLVNGNVVLSGIAADGFGSLFSFSAATGDVITTSYTTGSFENENTYEIRDGNGAVIGSDGPDPGPGITATGACPDGSGCTHEAELFDSFGDGWNGATMDVLVNGNVVLSGIAADGSGSLFSFSAATGDVITTSYTAGSFENENTYEIRDGNGAVIGSDGPDPGPGITATGNCPEAGAAGPACDITTEADCAAAGGSYQGDDTDCGGQGDFVVDRGTNGFEDISATGAVAPNASNSDDDGDVVPIGFTFNFFGDDHSTIVTTSNGYLTFGGDDSDFSNDSIPNSIDPNDLIAPLWDDYDPVPDDAADPDGTCYYETRGSAPNRRFIVQWDNYRQFANDDSNTFQAILFEGSNCIEYRYGAFTPEAFGGDITIGVENQDGSDGIGIDASTVSPGDSITICPERVPNTCPFVGKLQIKGGTCLAPLNRNGNGVTPITLVGTDQIEASEVDLATVTISRGDGVGGAQAPHEGPPGPHTTLNDVASPGPGDACTCDATLSSSDGVDDVKFKFKTSDLVAALELDGLAPGAIVELVVSGLLNSGDPFEASDCVRLVPPGTAPGMVRVVSGAANRWLDVQPLDLVLDGGGFGAFERVYPVGSAIVLEAPATTVTGMVFDAWVVDGSRRATGVRTLQLTVVNDLHDVRSLYKRLTSLGRPPRGQTTGTGS